MSIFQHHLVPADQRTHLGLLLNQVPLRHANHQSAYVHSQFLLLESPKHP